MIFRHKFCLYILDFKHTIHVQQNCDIKPQLITVYTITIIKNGQVMTGLDVKFDLN